MRPIARLLGHPGLHLLAAGAAIAAAVAGAAPRPEVDDHPGLLICRGCRANFYPGSSCGCPEPAPAEVSSGGWRSRRPLVASSSTGGVDRD